MINLNDSNTYIVFLLGLVLSNYISKFIYRFPRKMPILKTNSLCPNCKSELKWYHSIPLLSFVFLKGRCPSCREKISIQYPLIELLTGIVFALIYSYISMSEQHLNASHTILFLIAILVIIGIFTDFLYHGTFDVSTIGVCILFFIYVCIIQDNFKDSLYIVIQSLAYPAVMALPVILATLINKKRFIASAATGIIVVTLAILLLSSGTINISSAMFVGNSVLTWSIIFVPISLFFWILQKKLKTERSVCLCRVFTEWVGFVMYFISLFNKNYEPFSLNSILATVEPTLKNIILLILFSLFYLMLREMFELHNDDEELLDANDEIIEREDNLFTSLLGDGDILTLPFIGMLIGYEYTFTFFTLLAITIPVIYTFVFKRGTKYSIPLYPFMILNIFIIFYFTIF